MKWTRLAVDEHLIKEFVEQIATKEKGIDKKNRATIILKWFMRGTAIIAVRRFRKHI